MTATSVSTSTSLLSAKPATISRAQRLRELDGMSKAMIEERGLLNHAQAALLLDISTRRVAELVALRLLTRFDFLGRTYVSVREVQERYKMDLKAGRPKRSKLELAKASLKAAVKTDAAQFRQGGFQGPYYRAEEARKRAERRKKR
jgi:hypothetical protein